MKPIPKEAYPGLPKWPAVYVTGKSVTPEQAKDIITRTDTSIHYISEYGFGNNRHFRDMVIRNSGWKRWIDIESQYLAKIHGPDRGEAVKNLKEAIKPYPSVWDLRAAWAKHLGLVSTEYVYNSWMASAYIGGPTGWCHLDGSIYVEGHNYGKWPSVEAIVDDWQKLAKAFPYLDLKCTLHSGEHSEDDSYPVVTIVVKNGEVIVCEPDLALHAPRPSHLQGFKIDDALVSMLFSTGRENGWPAEWVDEFCSKSREALKFAMDHPEQFIEEEQPE